YRLVAILGWTPITAQVPASASSYTFQGLINGTNYDFLVYATYSTGQSPASSVVTMTPSRSAPAAPAAPSIKSVDTTVSRTLAIDYELGSENGSTITSVSYSLDSGASWTSTTSNPVVVSGLTNGTSYSFKLKATNYLGSGTAASKTLKPVATANAITFETPSPMYFGETQELDIEQIG
ncbi:MAG: fibronectin type III domain-containing protein, partial [Actinobacteria bacterium]|nr:fibronectin type III domain-containing protein [Actinomycetota bacterium]